ncbi:hypothetical protein SUDANB99_06009 (plasmid) [Streptomyces sp. enrichment culture]
MKLPRPADLSDRAQGLMLGAAVGDALGWPQEQRSGILGGQKSRSIPPSMAFRSWARWGGPQYSKYEDKVAAGSYSDDTQLILATARACLHGDEWLAWLRDVELPAWPLYQRGGGKAVLAACRAWKQGTPPWQGPQSKARSYFSAGANGVAMRIAPHALATIDDESPSNLIGRVLNDGILTHGHMRALLGAVVYGLAVRNTLIRRGAMEYGDLLHSLLSEKVWADPEVVIRHLPQDWVERYEVTSGQSVATGWRRTAGEMGKLFEICLTSLERSALSDDEKTLEMLGCFDPKQNGAGTVTTAGACYLASRFAVRPSMGLLRAAFLRDSDTDTLASMTSGLLGALHGFDWLSPLSRDVQDAEYIQSMAHRLISSPMQVRGSQVMVEDPNAWLARLDSGQPVSSFVDGREVSSMRRSKLFERNALTVTRYDIAIRDGQTVVIDVPFKREKGRQEELKIPADSRGVAKAGRDESGPSSSFTRIAIPVANLEATRRFYGDILGLAIQWSERAVYLNPWLALVEKSELSTSSPVAPMQITVHSSSPADILRSVSSRGVRVMSPGPRDIEGALRVLDPDGHEVLIWPKQ